MDEKWRPVVGYEGLYEISNLGRVKSVERTMPYTFRTKSGELRDSHYHVSEKILKQGRRIDGYADVSLSRNGVTILHCVHRLLAEAWVPNPNHYKYVNHIDLDKTNNSLNNLEWISNSGNVNHAVERYSNPQSIAIYCRETDQVYSSMGQCDRALGLTLGTTSNVIREGRPCKYTLSLATESEVSDAKLSIDAKCSWTFHQPKKGRLHPVRKIKCIDIDTVFDTLCAASKATGCSQDAIRASIRNKVSCKGLTFYYLDDAPEDESAYLHDAQTQSYYNIHSNHNRKANKI